MIFPSYPIYIAIKPLSLAVFQDCNTHKTTIKPLLKKKTYTYNKFIMIFPSYPINPSYPMDIPIISSAVFPGENIKK